MHTISRGRSSRGIQVATGSNLAAGRPLRQSHQRQGSVVDGVSVRCDICFNQSGVELSERRPVQSAQLASDGTCGNADTADSESFLELRSCGEKAVGGRWFSPSPATMSQLPAHGATCRHRPRRRSVGLVRKRP